MPAAVPTPKASTFWPASKLKQPVLFVNRNRSDAALQYGLVAGIPALQEQIEILLKNSSSMAISQDLLITAGCQDAIQQGINFAPMQLFSLEKGLRSYLRIRIGQLFSAQVKTGVQLNR